MSHPAAAATSPFVDLDAPRLAEAKFRDPAITASGEARARVSLTQLRTLWFNTGTLCNLACANCYIESTPRNDALVYLTAAEVAAYLNELAEVAPGRREIGFTGGEPFLNIGLAAMLEDTLSRGHQALVLTNAMRPMRLRQAEVLALHARHGPRLTFRVSLDHYTAEVHEAERGAATWAPAIDGLRWLTGHGLRTTIAGRHQLGEREADARAGYTRLFARHGLPLGTAPSDLVLFPEMDPLSDVAEVTEACWGLLDVEPSSVMCATSRMVVKRKGAARTAVVACTLVPYARDFEMGPTLAGALGEVSLNHPNCARFCVLGGASCSV